MEWYRFGVALAIGALVGLERQVSAVRDEVGPSGDAPPEPPSDQVGAAGDDAEAPAATPALAYPERWDKLRPAGFRTFMLVALCGAIAAQLQLLGATWAFPCTLIAVGGLTLASYMLSATRDRDLGLTSEVGMLLVFLLGGLCVVGDTAFASACAVALSVILSFKAVLHARIGRIQPADVHATLKFAVLSVIVLPMLPGEPLVLGELLGVQGDPAWWHTLSITPRKVWWMVVLISGVSFTGYVLGKWLGAGRGLLLTGAVGGLVSSTAVSLSFSQRSKERPEASRQLAAGILVANALMPLRLLLVTSVIAPALFLPSAFPLLGMVAVVGLALLVLVLRAARDGTTAEVTLQNPFEIGPALKFGAMFGVVLLLAQVLRALFGDAGLYVLAVVTGLTDVDAIGLAVAALVVRGEQDPLAGATLIALAALSNTVVKGGFVATLGSPQLRRVALGWFAAMVLVGAGGVVLAHTALRAAP